MSFLQGHVREREMLCIRRSQSMGGGTKKENHIVTASESIDSLPSLNLTLE